MIVSLKSQVLMTQQYKSIKYLPIEFLKIIKITFWALVFREIQIWHSVIPILLLRLKWRKIWQLINTKDLWTLETGSYILEAYSTVSHRNTHNFMPEILQTIPFKFFFKSKIYCTVSNVKFVLKLAFLLQ